jgi:hypothetical protein
MSASYAMRWASVGRPFTELIPYPTLNEPVHSQHPLIGHGATLFQKRSGNR